MLGERRFIKKKLFNIHTCLSKVSLYRIEQINWEIYNLTLREILSLLSFVFASRCCNLKACSNEANMLHPTMLGDVGCNMLASFEQAFRLQQRDANTKESKDTILEPDDFPLRRSP